MYPAHHELESKFIIVIVTTQGVDLDPKQSLAAGSHGCSLRQGSSFRSRRTTAQSGDGNESQQGVKDVDVCRVDCWNGGYLEVKGQSAVVREQQDWMEHNQQLLHNLQVSLLAASSGTITMDTFAAVCFPLLDLWQGHMRQSVIFILYLTLWGMEPVVTHQTSWLESTGVCGVRQNQSMQHGITSAVCCSLLIC